MLNKDLSCAERANMDGEEFVAGGAAVWKSPKDLRKAIARENRERAREWGFCRIKVRNPPIFSAIVSIAFGLRI